LGISIRDCMFTTGPPWAVSRAAATIAADVGTQYDRYGHGMRGLTEKPNGRALQGSHQHRLGESISSSLIGFSLLFHHFLFLPEDVSQFLGHPSKSAQ
jgi:hypothetical protein